MSRTGNIAALSHRCRNWVPYGCVKSGFQRYSIL